MNKEIIKKIEEIKTIYQEKFYTKFYKILHTGRGGAFIISNDGTFPVAIRDGDISLNQLDAIKDFLDSMIEEIINALELKERETNLELEDNNFRVNSDGWKKITIEGKPYLTNPEGDICELLIDGFVGEQLFTWEAAMRETSKVGERMPTNEEFLEILKTKEDIKNPIFAGNRNTDGSFGYRSSYAYFWSSSQSGADAWHRYLSSSYATVIRYTNSKAYGFSVRCLKN